jgi:hypothetical protein
VKDAALIFAAQYVCILLYGLQSLNVNQRRYIMAAVCSFLLGVLGFYVTSIVGGAADMTWTFLWWGFVFAGPAGICTAIWIHPFLVRWTSKR